MNPNALLEISLNCYIYTGITHTKLLLIWGRMKFLIALGRAASLLKKDVRAFQACDFGIQGQPFCYETEGAFFLSSSKPDGVSKEKEKLTVWDGAPIGNDIAFSTLLPVPDAHIRMEKYLEEVGLSDAMCRLSGVFGCAQITKDGRCIVATDSLSQYSFFYLSLHGLNLVSNSLHLIERACQQLGVPASRDFTSSAYEIAFGAGGWTRTGLYGVNKFPPNHYLVWQNNQLTFKPFELCAFASTQDPDSYAHYLQEATEDLGNKTRAMYGACKNGGLVADLSGGKDTRLVLASLLAGKIDNFQVFIGGAAKGNDRMAASRVARHYNLDSVYYLSNIEPDETISSIEAARRGAYRFMGTSNLYQALPGLRRLAGVAQIRGGAAEGRTKAFFVYPSARWPKHKMGYYSQIQNHSALHKALRRAAGKLAGVSDKRLLTSIILSRGRKSHHLFRQSFLQSAIRSISDDIAWLQNLGISAHNMADAYYIFDRGWRHCGFPAQVMNDSRTIFEPLNSSAVLKANFSLPEADRKNARLVYDLLKNFGVNDLLEIPFENGSWPGPLLTRTECARRENLAKVSGDEVPIRAVLKNAGRSHDMFNVGIPAYMKNVKPYMLELASGLPLNHHCWDFLQRDTLIDSIQSDAFVSPELSQTGIRLLHSLIWINGTESRKPLNQQTFEVI